MYDWRQHLQSGVGVEVQDLQHVLKDKLQQIKVISHPAPFLNMLAGTDEMHLHYVWMGKLSMLFEICCPVIPVTSRCQGQSSLVPYLRSNMLSFDVIAGYREL